MKDTSIKLPLLAGLVSFLALCLFLPGLTGGFVFDDIPNIVTNTSLHLGTLDISQIPFAAYSFQPGGGSRALSMLTFALDHWRAGLDPAAFKLTNLLIHAITTFVLAAFIQSLLLAAGRPDRESVVLALVVAALWAAHPLQVSTVLYVVQRMQALVTLFMLLALWAYLRMRQAQISGKRRRLFLVLTLLFGALGFASKEDAILLPVYALAMELTVFRFQGRKPGDARLIRLAYVAGFVCATLIFVLAFAPKQWSWDNYPGRDFSTPDRLLTQGRVLILYLQQILVPIPGLMPFFYDDIKISRGIFSPPSTLPAIGALIILIALAWRVRSKYPVASFGVLLFFSGHLLTSNILGLEMAFEHRNHLPMIGIILAAADLALSAANKISMPARYQLVALAGVLAIIGTATAYRAHIWGDPVRLAEYSTQLKPNSSRAWASLGGAYFEKSKRNPSDPYFEKAILANLKGAALTGSPSLYSNVVIYKTIRGDVSKADWERLLASLRRSPMILQNQFILWVTMDNIDNGMALDERGVLEIIDTISSRSHFSSDQYLRLAAYIYNETHEPGRALPYLKLAVQSADPKAPHIDTMLAQLRDAGREDWAQELENLRQQR